MRDTRPHAELFPADVHDVPFCCQVRARHAPVHTGIGPRALVQVAPIETVPANKKKDPGYAGI